MWAFVNIGLTGGAVMIAVFVWWAVKDYREHHSKPTRTKAAEKPTTDDETPDVVRSWEETCRSVAAMKKKYAG